MKIKATDLVEQLQSDVRHLILETEYLTKESNTDLTRQPGSGAWSVAQVLEHLNSYGRFYLPAIEKSLLADPDPAAYWFRTGWVGNYFTKIMRPSNDGRVRNRMKSPKDHRPTFSLDAAKVIKEFITQQHFLLGLLELAKEKNLARTKTPVSISRFIKLKTGDTLRFLIAHEQRHFIQIKNALKQLKSNDDIILTDIPKIKAAI